jgi:hypothetical protein
MIHLFMTRPRKRWKRQERKDCRKRGTFVTADEVAQEIQRVVRNHPEELGAEQEYILALAKFPPFFLALFAFPFSDSRLATKLLGYG